LSDAELFAAEALSQSWRHTAAAEADELGSLHLRVSNNNYILYYKNYNYNNNKLTLRFTPLNYWTRNEACRKVRRKGEVFSRTLRHLGARTSLKNIKYTTMRHLKKQNSKKKFL